MRELVSFNDRQIAHITLVTNSFWVTRLFSTSLLAYIHSSQPHHDKNLFFLDHRLTREVHLPRTVVRNSSTQKLLWTMMCVNVSQERASCLSLSTDIQLPAAYTIIMRWPSEIICGYADGLAW
ncbi:putative Bgh-specific protein [Blumeria hordei DH14]|uniref:Putative Bgh-specific protein n=1 Tax=Blumeria graminis f. sp. hordei (strain DH14) TaxID=546991 RepID=N1JJ61_BLUG1|nr:putative Bgh-specific protein [Blumeria hordei DH14]